VPHATVIFPGTPVNEATGGGLTVKVAIFVISPQLPCNVKVTVAVPPHFGGGVELLLVKLMAQVPANVALFNQAVKSAAMVFGEVQL
jgi:hypothetical protein